MNFLKASLKKMDLFRFCKKVPIPPQLLNWAICILKKQISLSFSFENKKYLFSLSNTIFFYSNFLYLLTYFIWFRHSTKLKSNFYILYRSPPLPISSCSTAEIPTPTINMAVRILTSTTIFLPWSPSFIETDYSKLPPIN